MSEPVSNAEVEDVLASIRRLVSEEKRPATSASKDAVAQEPIGKNSASQRDVDGSGKLVLTPSLRVMDGRSPVAVETTADTPHSVQEQSSQENIAQEQPVQEDEGVAGSAPATPPQAEIAADAPDENEIAAENARTAAALVMGMAGARAHAADDTPDEAAETAPKTVTPPHKPDSAMETRQRPGGIEAEARVDPSSLSAKIAALEAVIGKRQDNWEPDGVAASDDYSGTEPPTITWEDHVEDTTEDSAEPTPTFETAPTVEAAETPSYEPEGDAPQVEQGHSDTTVRHETVVEEALVQEAVAQEDEETALRLEEDAILDEETLRELVADIVRQELQGALGERITRNVRKLVRREIQRALTAQDLE